MNRPNKKDYEFSENVIRTMFVDFQIPSYLQGLEKYCDELEKENKRYRDEKSECEIYKKAFNRACLELAYSNIQLRQLDNDFLEMTEADWNEYILTSVYKYGSRK